MSSPILLMRCSWMYDHFSLFVPAVARGAEINAGGATTLDAALSKL
jgi:hypothetical protein